MTLEGQANFTTLKMRKSGAEGVNNLLKLPRVQVFVILPFHTALGGASNVQHQEWGFRRKTNFLKGKKHWLILMNEVEK